MSALSNTQQDAFSRIQECITKDFFPSLIIRGESRTITILGQEAEFAQLALAIAGLFQKKGQSQPGPNNCSWTIGSEVVVLKKEGDHWIIRVGDVAKAVMGRSSPSTTTVGDSSIERLRSRGVVFSKGVCEYKPFDGKKHSFLDGILSFTQVVGPRKDCSLSISDEPLSYMIQADSKEVLEGIVFNLFTIGEIQRSFECTSLSDRVATFHPSQSESPPQFSMEQHDHLMRTLYSEDFRVAFRPFEDVEETPLIAEESIFSSKEKEILNRAKGGKNNVRIDESTGTVTSSDQGALTTFLTDLGTKDFHVIKQLDSQDGTISYVVIQPKSQRKTVSSHRGGGFTVEALTQALATLSTSEQKQEEEKKQE